jgi:prepilin-type N-terminal cleavage/methylation domain-containing protein/prepilin-type processing-associated H-X9-DG protein
MRRSAVKTGMAARPQLRFPSRVPACAFTLVELLVVVAIIAILASILLPVLSKAKSRAEAVYCLNNTRQLVLAWHVYADDHNGRLAYNLGGNGARGIAPGTNLNWVNNIMDWSAGLGSDNTNRARITEAGLGPYTKSVSIYHCPSDHALSDSQRQAGWSARSRSYSMNAMVGDAGDISKSGVNQNNPDYIQFFDSASIPRPARIFIFLDEHPDSINDGYFLNKWYTPPADPSWIDLPASYHGGGASLAFADGHAEIHKWLNAQTKAPPQPDSLLLPMDVSDDKYDDFYWLLGRMSVAKR